MTRYTAILTVVCSLCLAPSVAAQETPLRIASFDLAGVESVDERVLRALLATQSPSWLPWIQRPTFDRQEFEADVQRIRAFYKERGYPHVVVTPNVTTDERARTVSIVVTVVEGAPVVVASIDFDGFTPLSTDELGTLRRRMPVRIGRPMVDAEVFAGAQLGIAALEEHGHAYARVNVNRIETAPDRITLRFEATPGPVAVFGTVVVAGNDEVGEGAIRRALAFRVGEPFRRSALDASYRTLIAQPIFENVSIGVVSPADESIVPPREAVVQIAVDEAKPQRADASFGYGTSEQFRGEAQWRHLNFLGGARTLSVYGTWSAIDRGIDVGFEQPFVPLPALTVFAQVQRWWTDGPAFDADTTSSAAGVTGRWGAQASWSASLNSTSQRTRVAASAITDPDLVDDLVAIGLDPLTGEQRGRLTLVRVTAARSTLAPAISPREGHAVSVRVDQAGGWLPGSFAFGNVVAGGVHFQPLGRDAVLASRLEIGSIAPIGDDGRIPLVMRFFPGGADSLRGWGRQEVGPRSATGVPLGGQSMLVASTELRVRLVGPIGGTIFVDAGNAWAESWRIDASDLLYDVGVGVRYLSPFGPIRIEAGYQLTPIEGLRVRGDPRSSRWRIHIGFGGT